MATQNIAYASEATITCTLASLTNGSARESTAIDNGTNKYLDALLRVLTKGQASGTLVLEIYAYGSVESSSPVYTDSATGSDAAFTAANIKNARFVGVVTMNTTTAVVGGPFSVAAAFGGVLPIKWGLIFKNSSGATLSTTGGDHVIKYAGITLTSA
jgi:hypothetical protein